MPGLSDIRRCLASHRPNLAEESDRNHAAVAAVLRETSAGVEILFIERAEHDNDPWSGHIAFPGGKVDDADDDARSAAERETREEIGLDLSSAEYLGQLDDVTGATVAMRVSAFAYAVEAVEPFVMNEEVKGAFWFPLEGLLHPTRYAVHDFSYRGVDRSHPTIDLLGRKPVLWGITYRLVEQLLSLLGLDPGWP